jgi:hypothetical protein
MTNLTGRDDWIIGLALFVASRALRAQPNPPFSDIADMERLIDGPYREIVNGHEFNNDIKRAFRLGWRPKGSSSKPWNDDYPATWGSSAITPVEIKQWLAENAPPDDNVIALFD